MMSYPKLDVIVPCYNVEHIITKCIKSIMDQEYNNTIVSSGFIILRPKTGYTTEFIFTLFKSKLVKKQMECL